MVIAFSSSCRVASAALLNTDGSLLWEGTAESPARASESCLNLMAEGLAETGRQLSDATGFVADVGPGSFTGVRVGIVLAKTLAYRLNVRVAGADAFDLISPSRVVVLPSKKLEYFVRRPGQAPVRTSIVPDGDWVGFGVPDHEEVFPEAARFGALMNVLQWQGPIEFVPNYLIEPSISTPKKPFARRSI